MTFTRLVRLSHSHRFRLPVLLDVMSNETCASRREESFDVRHPFLGVFVLRELRRGEVQLREEAKGRAAEGATLSGTLPSIERLAEEVPTGRQRFQLPEKQVVSFDLSGRWYRACLVH
jgi:hypothetical protein